MDNSLNLKSRLMGWAGGYPGIIWLLGFGSLINVAGLSLLWPVNAIYIHTVLGRPMTIAGLVLMMYSGAGFMGSALGGWLFDRIGPIPVLSAGLLVSAAAILVPVFWHGWITYILVMAVFGTACSMPFPVLSALAGRVWAQGGRRAFNFLYVSNNLGVAVGTAVGGVLAEWSFHSVFLAIACAYGLFLVVVWFVLAPRIPNSVQRRRPRRGREAETQASLAIDVAKSSFEVVPWGTILIVLLGFVAGWSVYVQWQSTISVYMQALGYPLTSYSILWTLNGLLIFASQPIVSLVTRRITSLGVQMLAGMVMYGIAFGLLMLTHSYGAFVLAMVITTFGEVFAWPSVPAFVAKVSPQHRLGLLQGMVQSGATLGRMIGPLGGGILYDHVGVHGLLSVAVPVLVIPALCFLWIARSERVSLPTNSNVTL